MSEDQIKELFETGVSARHGVIVCDKYGAEYAMPEVLSVEVGQLVWRLGARGPSPELGMAALNCVIDAGGVVEKDKCILP